MVFIILGVIIETLHEFLLIVSIEYFYTKFRFVHLRLRNLLGTVRVVLCMWSSVFIPTYSIR